MKLAAAVKPQAPAAKIPETTKKVQPSERPAVKPQMVQKSPEKPVKKTVGPKQAVKPTPQPEKKQAANPQAQKSMVQAPVVKEPKHPAEEPKEVEMDIDEFAKYACQYAGKIDCSISGKSMLALYERIEIMEDDGIALTKEEAENLIEEAADRAENPSFFKKITGLFSSKYDRDGLLILKEEHFL